MVVNVEALKKELESLVKSWRPYKYVLYEFGTYESGKEDGKDDCAEDLQRMLKEFFEE